MFFNSLLAENGKTSQSKSESEDVLVVGKKKAASERRPSFSVRGNAILVSDPYNTRVGDAGHGGPDAGAVIDHIYNWK